MNSEDFQKFIETLKSPNTIRVVNSMQCIGEYDYSDCTIDDIKQIILSMKPNSPKTITTICYVIGLYARYLEDNRLYNLVQDINRNDLWLEAKKYAPKKFISNHTFEEVYHDIGIYEEFNSFYYQMLFRCLYEGIYNDDMSVIKNLKSSDIDGNIITLYEDNGHSYNIEVSKELSEGLKELGLMNVWERKNRYGICKIKISGIHLDSCFKVEDRKGSLENAYRFSYYRVLRKISKEYLEYNLLPLQLYISGIMYRIKLKLKDSHIDFEDAFAEQSRNRQARIIIKNELERCNCDTEIRNFREIVKGHLDLF